MNSFTGYFVRNYVPASFYKYINLMETLKNGDELKIDFDCTQATEAIPNWAAEQGYPVTNYEQLDDASWTITVQKA
ncbi:sulfurtransferase TusA family protein [Staphylococcus hominis]|nr:sulfurtransferase TusA family protein [Staphylococcus hominis]MDS3912007.1 sulfurtransferase TusA family protein [Staphylococcus hominis]